MRCVSTVFWSFMALLQVLFLGPAGVADGYAENLTGSSQVAWGSSSGGLRAGIVLPETSSPDPVSRRLLIRPRRAEPMLVEIVIENVSKDMLQIPGSMFWPWQWEIMLVPMSGGTSMRAVLHPPPKPIAPPSPAPLGPSEQKRISFTCSNWIGVGEEDTYQNIRSTPSPGEYVFFGQYTSTNWEAGPGLWQGKVSTGEVEVEVISE